MKLTSNLGSLLALTLACGLASQQISVAKQGATDAIPGTSKGATNSGGGKKSSTTPTPTPTPTPAVTAATLTFTAAGPVNGLMPSCSGDYRIDPYYPTLLDMTLNVSVSSLNVPDGTVLYVGVNSNTGTLYPYTSNAIVIVGGAGICSEKVFVTPDAAVAAVVITDINGTVVFSGQ